MTARLVLHAGRERSLERGHPWLFSGAVESLNGRAEPGDVVVVCRRDGRPLARAAWSPAAQIVARVLSFDPEAPCGPELVGERVAAAVARRSRPGARPESDAVRLVHAEADGLPGVIADRYGQTVVIQLSTPFADRSRALIADALITATGCANVIERDADARALEGLAPHAGVVRGAAPEAPVLIEDHGLRSAADLVAGQKTGFFLDQRANRQRVREAAAGLDVLDAFCYSGGFAVAAAAGGARSVLGIDSSGEALELARANLAHNPPTGTEVEWWRANVFEALRELRDRARSFDLIVLDPPKLAPSFSQRERAARAYKDLNLLALKLLRPGGLLFSFSCSAAVTPDLLQKIVAGAAADAGVWAWVRARLGAASDHPVLLSFPEGEYLKGLVLEKSS